MYNKSGLWNMEMEKTDKTIQPSSPTARLGFLIPDSLYFTLCHIFTFQCAVHFCTDDVQLHWSFCQAVAVWDCGNQHARQGFPGVPKDSKFCWLSQEILATRQFLPLWRNTVKPANAFPLKRVLALQKCLSWCSGAECFKPSKSSDSRLSYCGFLAAVPAMWQSWPPGPGQPNLSLNSNYYIK